MQTKIKINDEDDDLWCFYSKERIEIGERYVEVVMTELGQKLKKTYLPEYAPTEEDIEDLEDEY